MWWPLLGSSFALWYTLCSERPFLRWTKFQSCCAVLIQRLFEYIVNIKFKTFYAVNVENKFRSHNFILMSRYINDHCGSQISMTVSEPSIVMAVSVRKWARRRIWKDLSRFQYFDRVDIDLTNQVRANESVLRALKLGYEESIFHFVLTKDSCIQKHLELRYTHDSICRVIALKYGVNKWPSNIS